MFATTQDDFHHCPHCGRRTRHAVVRERVLAPALWCLSCFHLHVESPEGHSVPGVQPAPRDAEPGYRLAG